MGRHVRREVVAQHNQRASFELDSSGLPWYPEEGSYRARVPAEGSHPTRGRRALLKPADICTIITIVVAGLVGSAELG